MTPRCLHIKNGGWACVFALPLGVCSLRPSSRRCRSWGGGRRTSKCELNHSGEVKDSRAGSRSSSPTAANGRGRARAGASARVASTLCSGCPAQIAPRDYDSAGDLERIPFRWNRNLLSLSFGGRVFCGEPVPTSPENALASHSGQELTFQSGHSGRCPSISNASDWLLVRALRTEARNSSDRLKCASIRCSARPRASPKA